MPQLLSDHFTPSIVNVLKWGLNVETVEDANRYTDEALLKLRGFGLKALHKLRSLVKAEIKQDLISTLLPSPHQYGDGVILDFGRNHQLNAKVTKVAFLKNSIQYDLDVEIWTDKTGYFMERIHGVSAARVRKK